MDKMEKLKLWRNAEEYSCNLQWAKCFLCKSQKSITMKAKVYALECIYMWLYVSIYYTITEDWYTE